MDHPVSGHRAEHILVCLSPAPSNGNIIRTAAKMSAAFGGALTALYVQPGREPPLSERDKLRLQEHIRLAESLGAVVATVHGEDVAYQIAEFARLSRVTKVVMGRSGSRRRFFPPEKPLTERLIELTPHVELYIIPDTQGENRIRRRSPHRRERLPALQQLAVTAGMLLGATLVGWLFSELGFTQANIVTVYILGVLLTALFTKSYLCSAFSSLASVLLFNFFLTEPRLTFRAYDSGYPVTFVIMLTASLITGTLANRLADNARQSAEAAARTKVLLETNQLLQAADGDDEILAVTAGQLLKLLGRALVVYPVEGETLGPPRSYVPVDSPAGAAFAGESAVAHWVLDHKKRAGASTRQYPRALGLYLAVRGGGAVFGVVGIHMGDRPLEPSEHSIVLSILGESALAMESRRNAREKEAAAVLAKNEQLRANLLRAISHDLRTPLTSISGNAENLLANDGFLEPETRKAVLSDIYSDSVWLIRLVENLLSITRIGEGRTQLNLSAQLVEEVITESLRHVRPKASSHRIVVRVEDELLLARMDARLISQVLVNLVDNAMKYTPAGSCITLSAQREGDMVAICVADDGPGIPEESKPRVFDMFYTNHAKVSDCRRSLGLGLALCKSIVNAHGGEITLRDNLPRGSVFTFTIPASEVTINE